MTRSFVLLTFVAISPWICQPVDAGGGPCAVPCGPTYVEKTVMVPQYGYETRTVTQTAYRWETRQRTVTAYRCVAETSQRTQDVTVMVPEVRTRTVNYTVRKPVYRTVEQTYTVSVPEWNDVEQTYTVQVPYQEQRDGTRIECRTVPVTETRTVCRDLGSWQNQVYEVPCCDPCGGCCTRTVCRPVWVPNVVREEVPVTVYKTEQVQVPYQYTVTLYRPETRTRTVRVCNYRSEARTRNVQVCDYVDEQQSKEVQYTVCVPTKQTRTYNVTNYRQVPYETVQSYQVCVPYTVEKPVQVQVCHMVPKTITVPVYPGCGYCP